MGATTATRPSMSLYMREDPRWREYVEYGTYGFAYEMGRLDVCGGFAPLAEGEIPIGYVEGYLDAYADFA